MKKTAKLRVDWSKKEGDLILHYPIGRFTKNDAHYLSRFFNNEFIKEMTDRGYDITTLKFEVSPKLPDLNLFETLTKELNQ